MENNQIKQLKKELKMKSFKELLNFKKLESYKVNINLNEQN
jgi:hypothetical protein